MNGDSLLSIKNVSFSFGKTPVVSGFSLEVQKGSFTTLLGPSGCGKTTLLRLISGFIEPDSGSILINGIDQHGIEVDKRGIGMVFQDYALFPHFTVEKNLLYGLNLKFPGKENAARNMAKIHKTARVLGIAGLLDRYPHQLSGGQQQRVALGRALVLEPQLLLMDEPLSSLDAKLRLQVREELKEIQSTIGITTVYVTHDQEEALSLSDNIAVINHGKLLQSGAPKDIYYHPLNEFVADFVGRANFINKTALSGERANVPDRIVVRPEWFAPGSGDTLCVTGSVLSAAFLGQITRYRVRLDDGSSDVVVADIPGRALAEDYKTGDKITLKIERFICL